MNLSGFQHVSGKNSSAFGYFALVSYVPDPLGISLDGLRQAMPGAEFRQAHITILPPRPLRVPVETASEHARTVLGGFEAFPVELNAVRRFPETNVFYLDVTEGENAIHVIHDALNAGELEYKEQFPFHPHLTIAGPVASEFVYDVQAEAEALWSSVGPNRRFVLREVVALWADPKQATVSWQRLWAKSLREKRNLSAITGRRS